MNIKQLYEKLESIDKANQETIAQFQSAQTDIQRDLTITTTHLERLLTRFLEAQIPDKVATLEAVFEGNSNSFSPARYLDHAASTREAVFISAQDLSRKYGTDSINGVVQIAQQRAAELVAEDTPLRLAEKRYEAAHRSAAGILEYNRRVDGASKLTQETAHQYQGPVRVMAWTFSSNYREARAIVGTLAEKGQNVGSLLSTFNEGSTGLNAAREAYEMKDRAAKTIAADLAGHDKIAFAAISDAQAAKTIAAEAMKEMGEPGFTEKLGDLIDPAMKEEYVADLVKIHNLERVSAFIDLKVAEFQSARNELRTPLNKVKEAKRYNPSAKAPSKISEQDIDRAVLAARVRRDYYAKNTRRAHEDAMTYRRSPDGYAYDGWYYNTLMFNNGAIINNGTTDPACSRDIMGLSPQAAHDCGLDHGALNSLQPDFGASLGSMSSLTEGLGSMNLPDMNHAIQSLDLGSVTQSIDTGSITAHVTTGGFDGGYSGGFSGGDGGGGGGGGGDGGCCISDGMSNGMPEDFNPMGLARRKTSWPGLRAA